MEDIESRSNDALKVGLQAFMIIYKEVVKNRILIMQLIFTIVIQMYNRKRLSRYMRYCSNYNGSYLTFKNYLNNLRQKIRYMKMRIVRKNYI